MLKLFVVLSVLIGGYAAIPLLFVDELKDVDAIIIQNDHGGNVNDYIDRWKNYRKHNIQLIIDGDCYSACGFFMSYPNVCATDESYFYLHGAKSGFDDSLMVDAGKKYFKEWFTPKAYALVVKYNVFNYWYVDKHKDINLENGVSKVYIKDDEHHVRGRGSYQVVLKIKATNLVRLCTSEEEEMIAQAK